MTVKMLVFDVRESEKEFFKSDRFQNFDITFYNYCLNDETIKNLTREELDKTMVISVFLDSELTEDVISAFKNLRIISTRSSSTDHINKNFAISKNIDVVNVEGYSSKTAAQFTIGLIIALIRNLIPLSKFIESGEIIDYTGFDISNLTLGVIGTGLTGACVCKIAHAFDMKVIAYDIKEKKELINNTDTQYVELETLLKEADIVTVHIPYSMENKNLISKRELDMMKESAYLINTSRAKVINIKDLYNALKSKKIKGAALDIKTCDSINPNCLKLQKSLGKNLECLDEMQILSELSKMPNVILTPQVAYKTYDVLEYIVETTAKGILDCIQGGSKFKAC